MQPQRCILADAPAASLPNERVAHLETQVVVTARAVFSLFACEKQICSISEVGAVFVNNQDIAQRLAVLVGRGCSLAALLEDWWQQQCLWSVITVGGRIASTSNSPATSTKSISAVPGLFPLIAN